ncbi:MAG TPA: BON domain-containing protein [Steroidobacteraceae bacterium]|nr:BON domain-containing protein [Steroidobacteraceae bacterium]
MSRKPLITLVATACIAATPLLLQAATQTTKVDDRQITEQVKQKLAMNDPTVAPHIVVTTHDGVVTLMGTDVPKGDILNAMHDAESVDGVVRVDNRLKSE